MQIHHEQHPGGWFWKGVVWINSIEICLLLFPCENVILEWRKGLLLIVKKYEHKYEVKFSIFEYEDGLKKDEVIFFYLNDQLIYGRRYLPLKLMHASSS